MSNFNNDPVIDISNLSVDFQTQRGDVRALRNVNLTIPQNKTVGIVGESGCGKSTLINSILRLLASNASITSGSIRFRDTNILEMTDSELNDLRGQKISMVFQDPMTALNPVITVGKQMIDILFRDSHSRNAKREKARDMLQMVGIPDAEDRLDDYPHQFSGGMRQRICIAMALMMNPALLIADEPTTALDVTLEAQVIHLLQELKNSFQCSILFVSHNLGLIAELCDEVVVMYAGEVVEQGDVFDLFHSPAHPYTQRLLECDPARIEKSIDELPTISGRVPDLIELPPGCIFSPRCVSKFEPCSTQPPPEFVVNEHHKVRCFLSQDG